MRELPYTIAVVDDDTRVLYSLQNLLESSGYAVHTFPSAVSFLAANIIGDIDCLITDIGMPGIDGLELQRLAALERHALPVILITARKDINRDQSRAANNHGIFQKPFDGAEFLTAVAGALRESGNE